VYDGLSEDPDAVLLHASGDRTRGTSVVLTNSNDALVIFTSGDYDVRSGFTAIAYADNGPLATLYDEPEFQGASILLQGRGLHNLMDRSVTRKASALRVSAGYSVTFFKDASLVGGNRTFTSDTANIGAFDNIATYAVVDRLVCSGVQNITATARGEPFSSNTQPEYDLNLRCSWRIVAVSGKTIRIVFTSFVTNTDFDFVDVYDGLGEDPDHVLFHKSSDRSGESTEVYTNSNNALVIFTSPGAVAESGFTAIAYADNGPLATLFDEPAYQGASIALQGRGLHNLIDRNFTNKARSLRISAGYGVTLFQVAHSDYQKRFRSNTPDLREFDSKATYAVVDRLVCSGMQTITASSAGEPFSSNVNPAYENNINCTWSITAEPGETIIIVFTSFVTEAYNDVLNGSPYRFSISGDKTADMPYNRTMHNSGLLRFISNANFVQSGFTAIAYAGFKLKVTPETSLDTFLDNGVYSITSGKPVSFTLESPVFSPGTALATIQFIGYDERGSNIRPSAPQTVFNSPRTTFTDIIVTSPPGNAIILKFVVQFSTIKLSKIVRLNVRNCKLGEVRLQNALECTLCPPGKFSRSLAESDCRPCPGVAPVLAALIYLLRLNTGCLPTLPAMIRSLRNVETQHVALVQV